MGRGRLGWGRWERLRWGGGNREGEVEKSWQGPGVGRGGREGVGWGGGDKRGAMGGD